MKIIKIFFSQEEQGEMAKTLIAFCIIEKMIKTH